MADFHFLRPWWLLALLPLALLYWRLLVLQQTQSGWMRWLPNHLASVLVNVGQQHKSWAAQRLGLFWLIACVALAGPTWERLPQPVYQLESGQVVIMDMSPSLSAEDIKPNRLTQARFKAMDLVKAGLDGDTGLIAYADDAFTISPLTADNNNLLTLIPSLSPDIMPVAGSEPLRALKLADELLKNAGYTEGDIYWITDGIATSELGSLTNYLRDQPHRVSILGVGTEQGAPIRDDKGNLLKDRFNQVVVAKMNPSRLADIAQLTGGIYQSVRRDNQDISALVNQPPLTREGKDSDQEQQGDQWLDMGPFVALLLLPLMLFSWRRGGSLGAIAMVGLLTIGLHSPVSFAQQSSRAAQTPAASSAKSDWWLNQEQQAHQLYRNGDYKNAANLTTNPMLKGAAQYRAGDYQAAADSFAQMDTAEGWYNRGNALAQQQQFDAAQQAYQRALEKRPDWQAAQNNQKLVEKLKKQQQKDKNGDGDKQGDQQNKDSKDKSKDSRDQNGDDQQDNPNNQSGNQDSPNGNNDNKQGQQQPNQQQSPKEKEQQQQRNAEQQQAQKQEAEKGDEGEQQRNQKIQFNDDIDPEKAQQLEQWMKRIPDDPSILLRNKMLLESQRRQRRTSQPEGAKKKW